MKEMELLKITGGVEPGTMLWIGIVVMVVGAWILWPRKGLLALISGVRKNSQRVMLEDALKFLFDCEYRNLECDLNSVAGNLGISADRAGRLLVRLLSMGLIDMTDPLISLTDTGRSYALRVIRIHRIWERYLADETGVEQTEWHTEADRIEHYVTREDTEQIAARMGNPVYDPHGDPIPSPDGELPDHHGVLLSHMKKGDIGRIIHIEDEPHTIYEQLSVLGLYPGMEVFATDVSGGRISFVADGNECVLTPLFASQISVEPFSGKKPVVRKQQLLSSLALGESAEIAGISPNCRGQQRRRLMDLGIVPGSSIKAEMRSPSGDPVGYRVMGTTIGIRKKHAELIYINKDNGTDTRRA
jgi:DtxR family Mn-dependent transcriptional regulator